MDEKSGSANMLTKKQQLLNIIVNKIDLFFQTPRAFIWIIAAVLFSATVPAQTTVQINGLVLNGSLDSSAVARTKVELLAFRGHSEQMLFSRTTMTNARGEYGFQDIPFDSTAVYYAGVQFDGVNYYSESVHARYFANNSSTRPVMVYHSTFDRSNLDIAMHHIFFQHDGNRGFVREVMVLRNLGNKTIVADTAAREFICLLGIPSGAEQVQLVSGLDVNTTHLHDHALSVGSPLTPGNSQFSFVYQIPVRDQKFHLSRTIHLPTNVLSVFTPSQNLELQSSGLRNTGPFTIRDQIYQRYAAETIQADSFYEIIIAAPAAGSNAMMYIIPTLAAAILLAGFMAMKKKPRTSKSIKKSVSPIQDLVRQRNELIRAIAVLDNQLESGQINPYQHAEQRQVHFNRLLRIEATKHLMD